MRSVILCEGSTDFILLQHYMRKVNGWEYKSNKPIRINDVKVRECELVKDDAKIISKCNSFVDCVDEQKRYLNKRRYVTKAKFDVYFSIRTSAEQFNERRNILKSVPWENYTFIQSSFAKLGEL